MLHRLVAIPILLAACAVAPAGEAPGEEGPLGHAGRAKEKDEAERYLEEYGYDRRDFEPVPDRWRIGLPRWKRIADTGGTDSPYETGRATDPYNQNVLKGDYAAIGQNTFLVLAATSDTIFEARDLPTPAGVSTAQPGAFAFFGSGRQGFFTTYLGLSFELLHGNTAFKPPDWVLRVTPVLNASYLDVDENSVVDVDPGEGTTRTDGHVGLQEAFFEKHLADLSPNYDFLSATIGIQRFNADFRGLLFSDDNLGARLTANFDSNRTQATLAGFYMLEKDVVSELNTFGARDQVVVVANAFRQDFLFLGYTLGGLFAYNRDNESTHVDEVGFPVRPAVIGAARPHRIDAFYLGVSGDGHIGRVNLTHEYFFAFGEDSRNPVAGRPVDVEAHMFFLESSVDFDWFRPRVSFLWASGDNDPGDGKGRGFDAILDNPNLAGGASSYWNRQGLRLLGVGLVQRFSVLPNLRSNKFQGQANFVNPGLLLVNAGIDADLTVELRASLNVSYMRFAETGALEPFANQNSIDSEIGWEATLSALYRPLATGNIQVAGGLSVFLPGAGFQDLYETSSTLFSAFLQITLVY